MDGSSRAGTPELEVRLLGPIEVERDGEPITLGGQKPRALLAVLALEPGRVVSIDRLVEALWPGDPPDTAPHAVQVYVSQLRKALGPVIATRPPGYVLDVDPELVDAHRFSTLAQEGRAALEGGDAATAEVVLREALALWRGPALADFLYEPFAQTQIARLEELRTVTVEERVEADLALGRHVELVSELDALVRAERLRERPRAQLMLALYRSGRQADALAAYRDARDTLVDELGIEPGPELRELEASILRQDELLLLEETPLARPQMQFRRLAAILMVDIVDSMALGETLDPEALAGVQRQYFETVSAALTRHGGTVEKYAGDAVMAAFGVPLAHEDDAMRAARAGLEIGVGIASLNERLSHEHGITLELRIGIAAGEVIASATRAGQRFVAGDPVGIAAGLQQAARPGEIVVGEVVARLIDHAAHIEPYGELEIPGRRQPFRMFLLHELAPAAPAFERRLDAPLVGRKRELAALRRSLKRATDAAPARVVLVVAAPGVGKSRLAAELGRRTKDATTLWGRCLSYGEGITYWPLREVLAGAEPSDERDAVLVALDSEPPPPAPEIAYLFRRFCEAVARERTLVLVFDDVHWAEPTFLELVEHIADKGEGPILVVCLARDELVEERSAFLEGRGNVDRILLDVLSPDDTLALLDGLGGNVLESDQHARIAETAEGNPLFVEQLLALALEGGLVERPLPETIQALLAARLDRLGPGERAVLERGAVVGKEFTSDDVVALLDAAAAPTADAHLRTLSERGFVRPRAEGVFVFRHALVREAVYRAAPKRLRAELHERFADRLEGTSPEIAEIDEFVGYHLEQAFRLRTELGESDRRTEQLAEDAGARLGTAGIRAQKRGDVPAARALLGRATELLGEGRLRRELLGDLAIVLNAAGESESAAALLERAITEAVEDSDRPDEARARLELEYVRAPRTSGATGDALLKAASDAVPILEAAGDDRWLGRALILAGWIHGGRRGQHAIREESAEQALLHYERAGWPTATPAGEIANALYYGPTSVDEGIERCEALLRNESQSRYGRANIEVFLGGLLAQRGDSRAGKSLIETARRTYEELGHKTSQATTAAAVLGDVQMLEANSAEAESTFRWVCDEFDAIQAYSHLASRAGDLAEALYVQGRFDEAAEWVGVGERHTAVDDIDARLLWMPVRAKITALRGDHQHALELVREAVLLSDHTDGLNRRASIHLDLGEILLLAGADRDAHAAFGRAVALFEEKGNVVGAARARARLSEPVVA